MEGDRGGVEVIEGAEERDRERDGGGVQRDRGDNGKDRYLGNELKSECQQSLG